MRWMIPERKLDEYHLGVLRACQALVGDNLWIRGFDGSDRPEFLASLAEYTAKKTEMLKANNAKLCIAVSTRILQRNLVFNGIMYVEVLTYRQILDQVITHEMVFAHDVFSLNRAELAQLNGTCQRLIFTGSEDYNICDNGTEVDDIIEILRPQIHLLPVSYRLTKKVMDIARTILPTSQLETVSTGRMQEVVVTLAEADSESKEVEWVWSQCRRYAEPGDPAAVLLPSHKIVQDFVSQVCQLEGIKAPEFPEQERYSGTDYGPANTWLAENGIPLRYLGNAYGDLRESDEQSLTYVMTYHSAKGLDFETVLLPFLNDGQSFWWKDKEIDRRLFFVGVTRSRKNLFLSYSGVRPHEYVLGMPQDLLHRERCEVPNDDAENEDFIF